MSYLLLLAIGKEVIAVGYNTIYRGLWPKIYILIAQRDHKNFTFGISGLPSNFLTMGNFEHLSI